MDINITTPALLFSAISLLMVAYTNRFVAIANRIRQFRTIYEDKPSLRIYKQIKNFKKRIRIIRDMQFLAITSFLFCVLSMIAVYANQNFTAKILFAVSLISLMCSLVFALVEIYISSDALEVELSDLEEIREAD